MFKFVLRKRKHVTLNSIQKGKMASDKWVTCSKKKWQNYVLHLMYIVLLRSVIQLTTRAKVNVAHIFNLIYFGSARWRQGR